MITTRAQTLVGALAVVGTITVAACAGAGLGRGASDAGAVDAYLCVGRSVPVAALADPTTAEALGADRRAALDEAEQRSGMDLGDLAGWWVLSASASQIVLLRPLPVPEVLGSGDVLTHEVVAAEHVGSATGWTVTQRSGCALTPPRTGTAAVGTPERTPPMLTTP
ncbi:hypothetical protein OEB99_19515 [Actinotalea sp. M2MS4P-6]|uniref:hypothetical protein n=1 Tax=Actinotalea sp. M2MS4P-6 TaxID=2983762 RepID=UPI0021E46834|nr:hypothetical protein [Actinotalea sp. M2MS4P-6]MCV2396505.1 hypothetical protein [Actinotalea sp. M2MS4P-6]